MSWSFNIPFNVETYSKFPYKRLCEWVKFTSRDYIQFPYEYTVDSSFEFDGACGFMYNYCEIFGAQDQITFRPVEGNYQAVFMGGYFLSGFAADTERHLFKLSWAGSNIDGTFAANTATSFRYPKDYIRIGDGGNNRGSNPKVWSFKVFEAATQVFNFVPCVIDQDGVEVGALYESINGTIHTPVNGHPMTFAQ